MVLLELLETLMSENRRVLIFSQFTSMLALIEAELAKRNYAYLKLTGKITQVRERQKLIDTFQTGEVPIFLLSLKTGGFGVNLTRADTVIHYDPWWNPAAEEQATDRSHRIGQTQPVFVYKLITEGTVEAVIQQMQEKKQGIVDDIFSTKVLLTEAMLSDFFQPHNELK
jgi:SNF2 family DNA or RNA helicase